jgi:hypothetical protein
MPEQAGIHGGVQADELVCSWPRGKEHRCYYLLEQKVDEVYATHLFGSDFQKKDGTVFGAVHSPLTSRGNEPPAAKELGM